MVRQTGLRIGFAVLCTSAVLALAAGIALVQTARFSSIKEPGRVLDLMPSASGQCLWWTNPAQDGNPRRTDVYFCNGDQGTVTFHPGTNKPARQVFYFKDTSRVRYLAEYAGDGGQILKGFALRDDGSVLWHAVPDNTGLITTTQFWWNGNVFSVEKRAAGSSEVDVSYFRSDKTPWLHYVGRHGVEFEQARSLQSQGMKSVELFDKDGKKRLDGVVAANRRAVEYTYLRADGTASHQQLWEFYTIPEGQYGRAAYEAFGITGLKIFASDGRLTRQLFKDNVRTSRIIDHAVDGSSCEYVLNANSTIKHITKRDAQNQVLLDIDITAKVRVDPEEDFRLEGLPELVKPEPAAVWAEQEKIHYRHTVVQ